MKKLILAAMLAAIAAPAMAQAPLPDADPALWVVKDEDTTIYLFGTIHALNGKQDWFNDEVKTAYDSSQELIFEIEMPDPATAGPYVVKLATDSSGKTLTSRLSPDQAKTLAAELASIGAPANALDKYEPWFASTQLLQIRMTKKGIDPAAGVEAVLTGAAKKDGKKIGGVETFEWQMGLFDGLSEELQLKMLTDYLEGLDEGDAMFDKLVETWAAGRTDELSALMNEALRETPELGRKLLDERNERWAKWIDERLDQPGTVFMAVGAGHLGGPNSVQDYLDKRGIKTARVGG